jgi:hypothetical protein
MLQRIVEYFRIPHHRWVLEEYYKEDGMKRWRCLRCGEDILSRNILKPSRNELVVVIGMHQDKYGYFGHAMTCAEAIVSKVMEE